MPNDRGSLALLVAGPLLSETIAGVDGVIGGAGAYAALAAAPLCPTQLWARGGGMPPAARGIFERRGVDCTGIDWSGANGADPALPTTEPVSAEGLGAVLLIDLSPAELQRALGVVRALPGSETRPLLIAPRIRGLGALDDAAAAANVLVVPADPRDPLGQATALQALGAKCVVAHFGQFGGIVLYGQKATTFPALPVANLEPTGAGSAFAGVLAGWCAANRKADFATIKRGLAMASAVAGGAVQGDGPRKLLALTGKEYYERFNKLRRAGKF